MPSGVVWCGVEWCNIKWCGIVCDDVVWCSVVWFNVEFIISYPIRLFEFQPHSNSSPIAFHFHPHNHHKNKNKITMVYECIFRTFQLNRYGPGCLLGATELCSRYRYYPLYCHSVQFCSLPLSSVLFCLLIRTTTPHYSIWFVSCTCFLLLHCIFIM